MIEVPILPNKHLQVLSQLRGSTFSVSYSDKDFDWAQTAVSAVIETKGYAFERDAAQIGNEVDRTVSRIRESITSKNAAVEQGNRELLTFINGVINDRKQKIEQNKQKLAALTKTISIPLKQKPGTGAKAIRIAHTPLVQRVKPKPHLPEEYVLDDAKANDVVALLDNQACTYERAPRAIKNLGEEDLRDLLLANLNSVFEGGATGETFSKKGKTDIYLRIGRGNILIAECKIWGGRALYDKAIDELRGYLTWRHNYGIVITFVRVKDFTKVLRECEAAIQAHPSYINGFRKISDSRFVSNNRVDDEDKRVQIHHLFYHLFAE